MLLTFLLMCDRHNVRFVRLTVWRCSGALSMDGILSTVQFVATSLAGISFPITIRSK